MNIDSLKLNQIEKDFYKYKCGIRDHLNKIEKNIKKNTLNTANQIIELMESIIELQARIEKLEKREE
tara:strand:+ start:158 stop:358 length:201 start_codon:yes stop_codon:yes gene_type:complete